MWILLFYLLGSWHAFYVSICYILKDDAQHMEVRHRIFRNDFELGMQQYKQVDQWIFSESSERMRKEVREYISSNFQIQFEGTSVELTLVDCYAEGEGVTETITVILRSEDVFRYPGNLKVKSSVLFAIYEDQVNMVHVIDKDRKRKSKNLDIDRPEHVFVF